MIADFHTKSLQGKQFYKLRDIIMGNTVSTAKEYVEENRAKDTVASTERHVSKKRPVKVPNMEYRISSNFDSCKNKGDVILKIIQCNKDKVIQRRK